MNESLQWLAVASSTRDSQGPAPPACTGAERWSRQVAPERVSLTLCCVLSSLSPDVGTLRGALVQLALWPAGLG